MLKTNQGCLVVSFNPDTHLIIESKRRTDIIDKITSVCYECDLRPPKISVYKSIKGNEQQNAQNFERLTNQNLLGQYKDTHYKRFIDATHYGELCIFEEGKGNSEKKLFAVLTNLGLLLWDDKLDKPIELINIQSCQFKRIQFQG